MNRSTNDARPTPGATQAHGVAATEPGGDLS